MSMEDDNKLAQETADSYKASVMEAYENKELYEYFEDPLDIEFHCDARKRFRSVEVMLAFGGPNVYVDTEDREVKCYWGGSRGSAWLPSKVCDEIEEIFEELWDCM